MFFVTICNHSQNLKKFYEVSDLSGGQEKLGFLRIFWRIVKFREKNLEPRFFFLTHYSPVLLIYTPWKH